MSISRDAKSGSPRRLRMETQDNRTDLIIYLNIMHNNNSTTRFAALLVATIFACLPSLAGWVYYDNVDRGKTNEQYASQQGDSGKYTIYFQNDKNWSNVGVWVWDEAHNDKNYTGDKWPGKIISTDPNHPDLYVYTFTCTDSNTKLLCIFNDGKSSGATETGKYEVTNGWVYNSSGKQKHIDNWESPDPGPNPDPNPDPDPDDDREFWIEPANATQLDGVTLWYNAAKNSTFKDWTDDLYAYIGIVEQGTTDWTVKADWNSTGNTDDCKFKKSEANRNLYYIKIEPSIAEWFNGNASKTYDKLNFIARSKDGKTQSPGSNQQNTITLATVPPEETIANFGAYKEYKINSET